MSYWVVWDKTFYIVDVVEDKGDEVVVKPVAGSVVPSTTPPQFTVNKESLENNPQALEELVFLRYLTETNVINNLKWRFDRNNIYTNCGLFLLAINPCKAVPDLYTHEVIEKFKTQPEMLQSPHLYAVMQKAYTTMMKTEVDQSILVSGISGSGKSESVKFAINYLSAISSKTGLLEKQIAIAGVILESFGNAKTILNNNSSRFGKYTKIYFDKGTGRMSGAEITTYLLEKSRVVVVPQNERNFHIFYQFCKGLPEEQRRALGIADGVKQFVYLSHGKGDDISTDAKDFAQLNDNLTTLGFSEEEKNSLWRTLAGILHLGNISFEGSEPTKAALESPSTELAAKLFGVEKQQLVDALTLLRSGSIVIPLEKSAAELSRDTLAKELYERLFNWLVSKINSVLKPEADVDDLLFIAILDISGYESLAVNSFEQLCINYTNDKLQQLFNEFIYREQELYSEEIGWQPLEFDIDLKSTLELLDKKPEGIFHVLDEVCYRNQASESDFVSELALIYRTKKHPAFRYDESRPNEFVVRHNPGEVTYIVEDFLVKNRDLLARSLAELMQSSTHALVRELFAGSTSSERKTGTTSVASRYLSQMEALMNAFSETECSFIKCIKPNKDSRPNQFDPEYVKEQIKWAAVMETIQLCDKGYPVHMDFSKFLQTYSPLATSALKGQNDSDKCKQLLSQCLKEDEYAVGQTKVLLALGSHFKLDLMLNEARQKSAEPTGLVETLVQRTKSAWNWLFS